MGKRREAEADCEAEIYSEKFKTLEEHEKFSSELLSSSALRLFTRCF